MQFSILAVITLSAVSSVYAATLAAQDKVGASCSNFGLGGDIVSATCLNTAGQQVDSAINLNQCTGNNNGVFSCQTNGDAGLSCDFSNIQDTNGFLTVTTSCLNNAGGRDETVAFSLDNCLTNNDGFLAC